MTWGAVQAATTLTMSGAETILRSLLMMQAETRRTADKQYYKGRLFRVVMVIIEKVVKCNVA
jgi:hypothetical protein